MHVAERQFDPILPNGQEVDLRLKKTALDSLMSVTWRMYLGTTSQMGRGSEFATCELRDRHGHPVLTGPPTLRCGGHFRLRRIVRVLSSLPPPQIDRPTVTKFISLHFIPLHCLRPSLIVCLLGRGIRQERFSSSG